MFIPPSWRTCSAISPQTVSNKAFYEMAEQVCHDDEAGILNKEIYSFVPMANEGEMGL